MTDYKKLQGKKNRAAGSAFELRVRKDLNEKNWIVDKWGNNVELPKRELISEEDFEEYPVSELKGKLIQAKNRWAGPNRPMMMGAGFPDFIAFRVSDSIGPHNYCEVIGVECKGGNETHKYLSKIEKEKCEWLLKNKVFSKILVANKIKVGRRVEVKYKEFNDLGDKK